MIIELFPCSGGMAEGLRRAGLAPDMAFDCDPDACASYTANLGHAPVQIDVRDLHRMVVAGWHPGSIDLLVADPPCTPWSRAGKRQGTADERDMLEVTVDLVRLLRPRAYLIANVPGLDDGPNWHVVQRTIGSLAREGYCVVDFAQLDAADFGVPQHRIRPFWYGHTDGSCITWPARTHGAPGECEPTLAGISALRPHVTCRDALGHLSPEDLGSPIRLRWRGGGHPPSRMDEPSLSIVSSQPGNGGAVLPAGTMVGNVLVAPGATKRGKRPSTKPRASVLDAPAGVVTASENGDGNVLAVTTKGERAQGGDAIAWPWDRPATTIACDDRIPPFGHHDLSAQSMDGAVKLSERAARILQGFPETWTVAGRTKAARWSQIGQAMPPPLAEAVARAIAAQMAATWPNAAKLHTAEDAVAAIATQAGPT